MIIRKGEFSFFCTVSSIKESGIFSADSTAFSNKLQNKESQIARIYMLYRAASDVSVKNNVLIIAVALIAAQNGV